MSVICGIQSPKAANIRERLLTLMGYTRQYGPDAEYISLLSRCGVGQQIFNTSGTPATPLPSCSDGYGIIGAIDGRLDNEAELSKALGLEPSASSPSQVALQAFIKWGPQCIERFIGEWALCICDERHETVFLARDPAGTRTLFFEASNSGWVWSTCLEAFFPHGVRHDIDKDYVAKMLCTVKSWSETAFKGIAAVPPGHYVVLGGGKARTYLHWSSLIDHQVHYKTDPEYEEHFLALFRRAVERRLTPAHQILAELSGGIDSSSIVCMADDISRRKSASKLVDTISYYDDTDSTWNERPYFTVVERHRGKSGYHIDVSNAEGLVEPSVSLRGSCRLYPGVTRLATQQSQALARIIGTDRYRVILSGIGGDELLGGVPFAASELADYLVTGRVRLLVSKSAQWAQHNKTTIWQTLSEAIQLVAELHRKPALAPNHVPSWILPSVRKRVLCYIPPEMQEHKRGAIRPSALANSTSWWSLLCSLKHGIPFLSQCFEYRYPYLDRELVEFLFGIPREQLIRPGQRRSLMRRALRSIVPADVLNRRRKAYAVRASRNALLSARPLILDLFTRSRLADLGLVDSVEFIRAVDALLEGTQTYTVLVMRTIQIELWLRGLEEGTGVETYLHPFALTASSTA